MSEFNDFEAYRLYLQKIAPLDNDEWRELTEILHIKNFDRKDVFHHAGNPCRKVGFIIKGCFRSVIEQNGNNEPSILR